MMIMSHKMILKIMTLYIKRWQLNLASFIKDARTEWVNNKAPLYLCENLDLVSNSHKYNTRSAVNNDLVVPFPNTSSFKTSFLYQGPTVWNDLPLPT